MVDQPTRRIVIVAVVLLVVAGVGPWTGSAAPSTEVSSCMTITESGTYVLTGDLTGGNTFADPCLVVAASNVTIEGEGHSVPRLATRGVSLRNVSVVNVSQTTFTGFTNVTNGRITDVDGEVGVFESRDVRVSDSRITRAFVRGSQNVTVVNNTVANGTVTLSSTGNSTIARNRPAPSSYATYNVDSSDNNSIVDNIARSGSEYPEQGGFHFAYGSTDNLIANNTVAWSHGASIITFAPYGFTFAGSGSNQVVNNTVNLAAEEVAYYASGSINTVVNLTFSDGANATFSGNNIQVSAATETPEPPAGYGTLGYYVEARSIPSGRDSWFAPTVRYNETAVSEMDERTLQFWQYGDDGYAPLGRSENASTTGGPDVGTDGVWRRIEGIRNVGGVNDVDPEQNIVYANITNLGAENRLVFRDQVTGGTNVTVEAVSLPRPGFVVVTDQQGNVRGVSQYLSAGVHDDIVVQLGEPLETGTTLTAVAQSDSNGNQQYDADTIREACTFVGPDGTVLRDRAAIDLVRPNLTPAITSVERSAENTLSVSVTLPEGGFVVVAGPDPFGDGGEHPTAGKSAYLLPGTHENVSIELVRYLETMAQESPEESVDVRVWLIQDNGDQLLSWSYNSPGSDSPYVTDDGVVVESITLSYPSDTESETTVNRSRQSTTVGR